jgi:hypothetical protein
MHPSLSLHPLVVPTNRLTEFTIGDTGVGFLFPGRRHTVDIICVCDCRSRLTLEAEVDRFGRLSFAFEPGMEGEFAVGIYREGSTRQEDPLWSLSFYVAPPDVAGLRPYKGDLHMHTCLSDGVDAPSFLVAAARAVGLDFAAITDHRVYGGSLEGIAAARTHDLDIVMIPGEEINYCLGLGHIVSLNATCGVAENFPMNSQSAGKVELESYENMDGLIDQVYATVADRVKSMDLPPGVDRRLYGYYYGVVERIREVGGTVVAAHPFWSSHGTMDMIRRTLDHVLSEQLVDAVEVFGGMSIEENLLSLSYMQQPRIAATSISLVGSSDTHSASGGHLGSIWTLVFTEELSASSIMRAIHAGLTTPCIRLGNDTILATGSFALVEYTYFLLREFFPRHDEICRSLGTEYTKALETGEGQDRQRIGVLRTALDRLYADCFGETVTQGLGNEN